MSPWVGCPRHWRRGFSVLHGEGSGWEEGDLRLVPGAPQQGEGDTWTNIPGVDRETLQQHISPGEVLAQQPLQVAFERARLQGAWRQPLTEEVDPGATREAGTFEKKPSDP